LSQSQVEDPRRKKQLLNACDLMEEAMHFEVLTRDEHEAHHKSENELPGKNSCFREQSDMLEQMRLFARHENIKYSENSYNEGIYIESARIH
jgi:hypothetical protein